MPTPPVTDPAPAQPAQLAKAALRRLVESRLEPTPENYANAYRAECGQGEEPAHSERAIRFLERLLEPVGPDAATADRRALAAAILEARWEVAERSLDRLAGANEQGANLAGLIERIVRGIERGGRQWTTGRRKDSLRRVLAGSRADPGVLQARLSQLVASWDKDCGDAAVAALDELPGTEASIDAAADPSASAGSAVELVSPPSLGTDRESAPADATDAWAASVAHLSASLRDALATFGADDHAAALSDLAREIVAAGATPRRADTLLEQCGAIDRLLRHRRHLIDQLGGLCRELTAGLTDLTEDESWAKGQLEAMRRTLDEGINARSVRAASEQLRETREHQRELRDERGRAREALKSLMNQMLQEIGELGSRTGKFYDNIGRYSQVISGAQSLESLTGVVGEMLEETRSVQEVVGRTQQRLQAEHSRTSELAQRVATLESELRRLSDEATTDQLTRIANRRGLMLAFDVARSTAQRDGQPLAIGLLDVDNFKRLNDELGHGVGDVALKALAGTVSKSLRPGDIVARYGGEEFVVVLPATPVEEGQQILTRLQRSLSSGLFLHERKTVLVTFSAGITCHREGEAIEMALERADQALYEAKRTGKNRTCIA